MNIVKVKFGVERCPKKIGLPIGCDSCVLPVGYAGTEFIQSTEGSTICNYCTDHREPVFLGFDQLIKDLDLQSGEKVGVTVSGGKDSIWMWMKLVDILGSEKVTAFNHHKAGLVHPLAEENVQKAKEILHTDLVMVSDEDMHTRFKKNLEVLLGNPDPAMIRVALCVGCRYGITGAMYAEGKKLGINKFMSAASYLELAPFKSCLMKMKGSGDEHLGLEVGLKESPEYSWSNENLIYIRRDDAHCYKTELSGRKSMSMYPNVHILDLDTYVPNIPSRNEEEVKERIGWRRPARSWHFDCQIESFKDVFYYGTLGYTETDFNLSAMVRHGLISREEALKNIYSAREEIVNGKENIFELMELLGVGKLKDKMNSFYEHSKFLSGQHR